MSRTVALIGATCWGNRGAEAMLATSIGVIRRRHPDARFHVFSYYPKRDRELIRDPSISVLDAGPLALVTQHLPFAAIDRILRAAGRSWPRAIAPTAVNALRDSDVLVDLGGISFADGRARYLPFNVLCIYPAMLLGVPVVKLAQALGPFERWTTRVAASIWLARCRHVVARGARTFAHLQSLRLGADRYSVAPDVAFAYRSEFSLSSENCARVAAAVESLQQRGRERVIGLAPSTLVDNLFRRKGRDYVQCLADLAAILVGRGFHVAVVPNATREGSDKSKNNDLIVIAELRRRLEARWAPAQLENITWIDFDLNTRDVRRIISCVEVLVTSRFHAMVAALATHTPVLVLGWSHKYGEVLERFSLDRFAADVTTPFEHLSTLLDDLLTQSGPIRRHIAAVLPQVQESALRQFEVVEAVLE